MDKLQRNYQLTIGPTFDISGKIQDDTIHIIELPITLEFNISQNINGGAGFANIKIYNLDKGHRSNIRFDSTNIGTYKLVTLNAGYGNNLATIFVGNIQKAFSYRQGTNYLTEIDALDGAFAFINAKVETQISSGTALSKIIAQLLESLAPFGIKVGAIGSYTSVSGRDTAHSGNTCDILKQLTGGGFYVYNGKGYSLQDQEFIANGGVTVISSESGLLGTPILQANLLTLNMIFDPTIILGQLVQLVSTTGESDFNEYRKVISVQNKAIISPTVCGDAITTLALSYGIRPSPENAVMAS